MLTNKQLASLEGAHTLFLSVVKLMWMQAPHTPGSCCGAWTGEMVLHWQSTFECVCSGGRHQSRLQGAQGTIGTRR